MFQLKPNFCYILNNFSKLYYGTYHLGFFPNASMPQSHVLHEWSSTLLLQLNSDFIQGKPITLHSKPKLQNLHRSIPHSHAHINWKDIRNLKKNESESGNHTVWQQICDWILQQKINLGYISSKGNHMLMSWMFNQLENDLQLSYVRQGRLFQLIGFNYMDITIF